MGGPELSEPKEDCEILEYVLRCFDTNRLFLCHRFITRWHGLSSERAPAERHIGARVETDMKHLAWTAILLPGVLLAGTADQPKWQGTWAATVGGGTTALAGTWNAAPGDAPDTIAGTWSLRDQNGTELATGTWAAGKEGRVWKGSWQARRASGQIYNGTWRAQAELAATSHLPDLFAAAIAKAVSGSWRIGNYSGAWTIRVYAQKYQR